MFSSEDYFLRQINEALKALAKLIGLIQSKNIEEAQEIINQNIDVALQSALLRNEIDILSKANKQVLEFQIDLTYQQIIILNLKNDINLKIRALECLTIIKNYNGLNNLTFNFNLLNKSNMLQRIIADEK